MRTIKIGIIGCGVISNTYISDIKRLYRELEIAAVADVDLARAQSSAGKYGIAKACTVEELLADSEIELAVNLTPPAFHTQINRKVLQAGKHLFCEKPFALNLADAQEIVALAREKGLKLGCAPDSFMGSSLSTCRKLLQDNWIGRPLYVCVNMMNCGVETWHPQPENFYRQGGGPLFDMGGYYFTALVSMLGSVESVYAVAAKGYDERTVYTQERFGQSFPVEVPTHYSGIITMESGVIVNANFSFDIWKTTMPMFEIYGTDGTLMVPDPNMHGGTPKVYRKEQKLAACFGGVDNGDGEPFALPELAQNVGTYVRCLGVADLAEAIRNDCEPQVNGELAVHVLEAILGMMESAKSGQPYRLTTRYDGAKA